MKSMINLFVCAWGKNEFKNLSIGNKFAVNISGYIRFTNSPSINPSVVSLPYSKTAKTTTTTTTTTTKDDDNNKEPQFTLDMA